MPWVVYRWRGSGELRFRHEAGLAKVALGQLDAALRDRFGYNADEAAAWQAAELKRQEIEEDAASLYTYSVPANSSGSSGTRPTPAQQSAKDRASATRRNFVVTLNNLIASARQLQADRRCCPVYKRERLAALSQQANRLRARIAAIPAK